MNHKAAKLLLISAILCLVGSNRANASNGGTIAVQWAGGDGLIAREIAFRTSEQVDWESFWRGMFKSTPVPLVDFSKFEAVGLILPQGRSAFLFVFDSSFVSDDHDLVLSYRINVTHPSNGSMTGSRYAIAIIPKAGKTVVFRPMASNDPERNLIREQRWQELEASELNERRQDQLPAMPMVLSGGSSIGTVGFDGEPTELIEVFRAGAAVQKAGGRDIRLAHVAIAPDPALQAQFTASRGEPGEDAFARVQHYQFNTRAGELEISFRIDGRQQTLTVDQTTFDLREGNFFRIDIGPDRRNRVMQIKSVRAESRADGSDDEEVKSVYRDHPVKGQ